MTKCNLCFDNLEQGLPPACVAACPMRALDYQDVPDGGNLTDNRMKLWQFSAAEHPFPLPVYSRTQPRLAVRPHPAMKFAAEKTIANHEEIQPRTPSQWEEAPLIAFTLLTQMAVGMYGMMALTSFPLFPSLVVGLCLVAGMLAAFTHLGNKKNAWRAMGQLGRSRMSDEIFFLTLFGVGWLTTITLILNRFAPNPGVFVVTVICGGYLIHNMAEVYRLPAATRWNTRRTNLGFLASTLLLGGSAIAIQWVRSYPGFWIIANSLILIVLLLQLGLLDRETYHSPWRLLRAGLLSFGAILALMNSLQLFSNPILISVLLFVVVLLEETIGRWLFYRFRI
jgi:DMSO reductase anchor subunit